MIAKITQTRQTRVLNTISILAGGALLTVLFLYSGHKIKPTNSIPDGYDGLITTSSISIPVTIADTQSEQEQGLSDTLSLAPNTGKLFVFNTPGRYGFWMKDMHYGLDLIWIDKDFKVVGIDKGVTPETYPKIFYPPQEVGYVLEVNSGFSTIHDISLNQLLTLHKK